MEKKQPAKSACNRLLVRISVYGNYGIFNVSTKVASLFVYSTLNRRVFIVIMLPLLSRVIVEAARSKLGGKGREILKERGVFRPGILFFSFWHSKCFSRGCFLIFQLIWTTPKRIKRLSWTFTRYDVYISHFTLFHWKYVYSSRACIVYDTSEAKTLLKLALDLK